MIVDTEADFDPQQRILCSDDGCIGLVGADGRCKACGLPGPAGVVGQVAAADADDDATAAADDDGLGADFASVAASGERISVDEEDDDFANRRLCADDTCIGVIGVDGRCRRCGRAASEGED